MRIGLFGGTFDPPHLAHVAASLLAMKRLKLDRVWWLVTPGNPLKNTKGLAPLGERIDAARKLTHHPRLDITGVEAAINTRYTYERSVADRPPARALVRLGADNLRHFHRWQKWREIAGCAHRRDRSPGAEPMPAPAPRAALAGSAGTTPARCPTAGAVGTTARAQIAAVVDRAALYAAKPRLQKAIKKR